MSDSVLFSTPSAFVSLDATTTVDTALSALILTQRVDEAPPEQTEASSLQPIIERGIQFPVDATLTGANTHVVSANDLQKLVNMGLGKLPVSAVGIPASSPILRTQTIALQRQQSIRNDLAHYLPRHLIAALMELQSILVRGGFKAYVVGGYVRDMLLYQDKYLREVDDVDLTVEGDALQLAQYVAAHSRNVTVLERFPEFGTVKLLYKDTLHFDVASTREEHYPHCGALPVVTERGVPLPADLVRRDFTANALAMAIHDLGEVLDYANGIADIEHRKIRVLHPLSFFEDPSRILRAFKFLVRLDFQLTDATQHLLEQFLAHGAPYYAGGGERIRYELEQFLISYEGGVKHHWLGYFQHTGSYRLMHMATPAPTPAASSPFPIPLAELTTYAQPVLDSVFPDWANDPVFLYRLYMIWLTHVWPAKTVEKLAHRLSIPKADKDAMALFAEHSATPEGMPFAHLTPDSEPEAILDAFGGLKVHTLVALAIRYCYTQQLPQATLQAYCEMIHTFRKRYQEVVLELNGTDLMEMGFPEGEGIGQVLKQLRLAKLRGQLPTREAEIAFVRQQLLV